MQRFKVVGAALFLFSLIVLLTTVPWDRRVSMVIPISSPGGPTGMIKLRMPSGVFAGDRARLSVELQLDSLPASEPPAVLLARFETGLEEVRPSGTVSLGISSGLPVSLMWNIRAVKHAAYPGTLWVWLESAQGRELLLAREVEIRSDFYLGMRAIYPRTAAAVLLVLSLLMEGFAFRHRKKSRESSA